MSIMIVASHVLTKYRLKESDVTWLYGPLKPATTHPITQQERARKPIKKRMTTHKEALPRPPSPRPSNPPHPRQNLPPPHRLPLSAERVPQSHSKHVLHPVPGSKSPLPRLAQGTARASFSPRLPTARSPSAGTWTWCSRPLHGCRPRFAARLRGVRNRSSGRAGADGWRPTGRRGRGRCRFAL